MEHEPDLRVELPFGPEPELEVHTEMCGVTIVPLQPGETPFMELDPEQGRRRVRRVFGFGGHGGATQRVQRVGSTVQVRAEGVGSPLVLHVPATTRIHVKSEVGSVTVAGMRQTDLDIDTEVGHVRLTDVTGRLRVRTEAGKLDGHGVGGSLQLGTEAGSVRLQVTHLDPGEHRIETEVGSVNLELVPGLPVHITGQAEGGNLHIDYREPANPTATLVVLTELGSIRVHEGAAAPAAASAPTPPTPPTPPVPPVLPVPPAPPAAPAWPLPPVGPAAPTAAAAPPASAEPEDEGELERILGMVAAGKLSVAEAQDLIRALERD